MPFNRFLAFGSNVFDILVLYRVYFSTCSLMFIVWVLPIWRRSGFKKLDSKTIGCSIQSFFEISDSPSCYYAPKSGSFPSQRVLSSKYFTEIEELGFKTITKNLEATISNQKISTFRIKTNL